MTNLELFMALLGVASLALTIYFGSKRRYKRLPGSWHYSGAFRLRTIPRRECFLVTTPLYSIGGGLSRVAAFSFIEFPFLRLKMSGLPPEPPLDKTSGRGRQNGPDDVDNDTGRPGELNIGRRQSERTERP